MAANNSPSDDQVFTRRGMDLAIKIAVLAIIVFACFQIFSPFLMPVLWGIIIAVAVNPVFLMIKKVLGGRNRLAGIVFIVVGLALLIIPTWLLTDSMIEGTVKLGRQFQEGTFEVNPPSENIKTWPIVGERLYTTWTAASRDLQAVAQEMKPQLRSFGTWLISVFTGFGMTILQFVFALIIAGIMLMNSSGGGRISRAIGRRLAGDKGVEMVGISEATIQSVVKGVLLIAIIQCLLAAIGMYVAHVPMAGVWALLVLILAVVQLPPWLILIPVIIYVFSASDSTVMPIIFAVYAMFVSMADMFLKPLFLGRGIDVPMVVILIGAIGGMIVSGIIGLFIGAVILAVGYKFFIEWVEEARPAEEPAESDSTGSLI